MFLVFGFVRKMVGFGFDWPEAIDPTFKAGGRLEGYDEDLVRVRMAAPVRASTCRLIDAST